MRAAARTCGGAEKDKALGGVSPWRSRKQHAREGGRRVASAPLCTRDEWSFGGPCPLRGRRHALAHGGALRTGAQASAVGCSRAEQCLPEEPQSSPGQRRISGCHSGPSDGAALEWALATHGVSRSRFRRTARRPRLRCAQHGVSLVRRPRRALLELAQACPSPIHSPIVHDR
jgi:hypothetical protein